MSSRIPVVWSNLMWSHKTNPRPRAFSSLGWTKKLKSSRLPPLILRGPGSSLTTWSHGGMSGLFQSAWSMNPGWGNLISVKSGHHKWSARSMSVRGWRSLQRATATARRWTNPHLWRTGCMLSSNVLMQLSWPGSCRSAWRVQPALNYGWWHEWQPWKHITSNFK